MQDNSYQNENILTSEETFLFINELEETELLKGNLNNETIIDLDETNINQKYKLEIIDNSDLSDSDDGTNDI